MTTMVRISLILLFFAACVTASSAAQAEDPARLVKGWLTEKNITYAVTESGEIAMGFEGEKAARIDVQINFSDEFIHFATPIDFVPDKPGEAFYQEIIALTGPVPMVKPIIDDQKLFYLAIDLPLSAMSLEEVISDIALLVEFTDENYAALRPWVKE